MPSLLGRLYRRLGPGYFWLYMALEVVSVLLVCLATAGVFSLYTEMDASEFLEVTLFAELCAAVVVGSVGGGGRLEFSVIGDPVDICARAERATRDTGDVVLLTESTRALLTRGREKLVPRGALEFKGITHPVSLYALPSPFRTPVDERPTPSIPPLVADV